MSSPIRREGPRVNSTEIESSSTSKTISKEKTSGQPEGSQTEQTTNREKQTKAAQDLATARRFDGHLQAISQQIRLKDLSETGAEKQQELSVQTGKGGNTVLPQGDSAAVSESYAAKAENNKAESNTRSAIRKEIADALGVTESDPEVNLAYARLAGEQREKLANDNLAANQAVIDAARTYGRREEVSIPSGPGIILKEFKEYVPGKNAWEVDIGEMPVFLRKGTEITKGDEILRSTKYFDSSYNLLGMIQSKIKGNVETITNVTEYVPGSIALKPGDIRKLADPKSTEAGAVPSTFDPQPNGKYGSAGVPNNTSGSSSTGGEEKTERPTIHEAGNPNHDPFYADPGANSSPSGTSNASGSGSNSGRSESSGGKTVHKQGEDGEWEPGPSSWSEYPPTEVEVEEPETPEGLEEEAETNQNDDGSQAGWGDYAEIGPAPPPQEFGATKWTTGERDSSSSGQYTGGRPTSDSSGYADRPGAPIDYGNTNDANANSDSRDNSDIPRRIGPDPTVTDPGQNEGGIESEGVDIFGLEMTGTLRDGGNPLDPAANIAPAGKKPSTKEAEHVVSRDDDVLP